MKKYSIILLLFLFTACELIVDVDVPFDGEQIVVDSFFDPDSLWKVTLSLNRHILDPNEINFKRVSDAVIEIHDENGLVTTLQYTENGKYVSLTEKPAAEKQYTMFVNSLKYGTVNAVSHAPVVTLIKSVEREDIIKGNERFTVFRLKIHDKKETKDFYHLKVDYTQEQYNNQSGEIRSFTRSIPIGSDNPELSDQFISAEQGLLIKDVLFNGEETEIKFRIDAGHLSGITEFSIALKSISEDYFRYMATRQLQKEINGDPFAQPVNVFNNVTNGFGIFAGLSTSAYKYETADPIITAFEPAFGKPGDTITIRGSNFGDGSNSYASVRFYSSNDRYSSIASVLERSNTHLKVVVPQNAVTGKVLVGNSANLTISDIEFQVTD
jgi:hypothetical protein